MLYSLFPEVEEKNKFPSTRYQGSKAKFTEWIWFELSNLDFSTALDAFGGTGAVAYLLKEHGKEVTYNDIQPFNTIIGRALIENSDVKLDENTLNFILDFNDLSDYPRFISENFKDIYYTDEENDWLDKVRFNICQVNDKYQQSIAWFALFQACIIKRPYNLFHRKNLYVRLQDVERSFGNKKTWDTPFETHFRNFVKEANQAVFSNERSNVSLNYDALEMHNKYDLVYIDTPYINTKGVGVDYGDFYHFLNGLVRYDEWASMIDYTSKHHRLKRSYSIWNDKDNILNGFKKLIENFSNSIIVFSYRSNGIPSINELVALLDKYGRQTEVKFSREIKYALSDTKSQEVLIISKP